MIIKNSNPEQLIASLKKQSKSSLTKRSPQSSSTYDYPTQKFFINCNWSHKGNWMTTEQQDYENYRFNAFNIKSQRSKNKQPEPFMGAFMQTQRNFTCFDLNISIPSLSEVSPFSRILSNPFAIDNSIQSQILSHNETSISKIEQQSENIDDSYLEFFSNYNEETHIPLSQQQQQHLWDSETESKENSIYQFHISTSQQFMENIKKLTQLKSNNSNELIHFETEHEICVQITKMLQGFESQIFTLDYNRLQWYYNGVPIKLPNSLPNSFSRHLSDILTIATYKSRMETAMEHIKKYLHRHIYQELSYEIKYILNIIEETALEVLARNGSFFDYVMTVGEFKIEVTLLYQLLIKQENQQKSYMDFNYTFLNAQAIIFKQVMRLSANNDSQTGRISELTLRLLRAVFKPITFPLNRIIFQEDIEISNYDETYLRYYFENMKDIVSYLGKRIDLIKKESNQLYLICHRKDEIKIVVEMQELREYDRKWQQIFQSKKRMIEDIRRREKKRLKEAKQKKYEKKIKEIYELKMKLYNEIKESKQRKSQAYIEGVKEIQRLKQEIAEREERRRLNYLIEKQQEKGFLLEAELKEKRNLIQQRQMLLKKAEEIGINITNTSMEVSMEETNEKQSKTGEPLLTQQQSLIQQQKSQPIIKSPQPQVENNTNNQQNQQSSHRIMRQDSNISGSVLLSLSNGEEYSKSESEQSDDINCPELPPALESCPQQTQMHVSTNTVLQICIDNIIKQQIDITHCALSYLVYDQYQLLILMEFMRKIFFTANGGIVSQLLNISVNKYDSTINLKFFNDCPLFDYVDDVVAGLAPQFYEMSLKQKAHKYSELTQVYNNRKINIFHQNLQSHIGFQFRNLPVLLEPYFSYIHLSKYMEIFAHIFKIRHCSDLMSSCLLALNEIKRQYCRGKGNNHRFLQKLYTTRYVIQSFLSMLQNYLYYRVIEKQIKVLSPKLKAKELNQLSSAHLKMLDNIIRVGLIENPHNDISKKVKGLLNKVREFKNIVDMFCGNDLPTYIKGEIQGQVHAISFEFQVQTEFIESLFYHP